jgi:hypothetical protein
LRAPESVDFFNQGCYPLRSTFQDADAQVGKALGNPTRQ